MQTMHPTLLIGPADWDGKRMPMAEYRARLDALWRAHPGAGGAIVYGNAADYAALAYLTHFTPKLEQGIALLARDGSAKLLVGGGINMIPAAKPLTWVADLLPLRNAAKTAAEWAAGLAGGGGVVLIGGDAMPYAMHREVAGALDGTALDDGAAAVQTLMRVKSARERAAMQDAAAMLTKAVAALHQAKGESVTAALLAAEQAAWQSGAQDVRSLFSLDGGRTLRPFERRLDLKPEPLQVYLAVRHAGYWAEGFVMLSAQPHPPLTAARSALQDAIALVKAGVTPRKLLANSHPMATPAVTGIGLSLQQDIATDQPLIAGEVLSLRAGSLGDKGAAILSAVAAVTDQGCDVLWSPL